MPGWIFFSAALIAMACGQFKLMSDCHTNRDLCTGVVLSFGGLAGAVASVLYFNLP